MSNRLDPWDDVWMYDSELGIIHGDDGTPLFATKLADDSRAQLAAAAPDMFRALAELALDEIAGSDAAKTHRNHLRERGPRHIIGS
jgi:hypothetical protein